MTILWRPSMAIGDASVDADHQQLIDIINTVELQLYATTSGSAELSATLDQLTAYTNSHFEREEALMRYTGYNGLAHHHQSHVNLRTQLRELRSSIKAAKSKELPEREAEHLEVIRK